LKLAQHRPQLAHIHDIAYDTATIQVRHASGDVGTFVVCWGLPPAVNPEGLPDRIMGPKGLAQTFYGMAHQQVDVMREGGAWETVATSRKDMYQVEIARFAEWVLEDRPFPATGAEGLAALRVALAALESVETGRAASLSP
jgi:predicted dehydrogenase